MLGLGLGLGLQGNSSGSPPVNTVAPVVSGTAIVGQNLTVTPGTWTNSPELTYQWRRNGVAIEGETNETHTVVDADRGTVIDVIEIPNGDTDAAVDSNNISVSAYLDGVLAGVLMDLDATESASYPGSGTTWLNLSANGGSTYNMPFVGTPVFTGTPGDNGAYFALSNGNYFQIAANTAFINAMHKTTGGQDWTIILTFNSVDGTWTNIPHFIATRNDANGIGMAIFENASENINTGQTGDTGATTGPCNTTFSSGDYMVIISHSHSLNKTDYWAASATRTGNIDHTFNATTSDAAGKFTIGAESDGGQPLDSSNILLRSVALIEGVFNDTKAATAFAHLEARHGRDYTP